jgi:hypothetical protein
MGRPPGEGGIHLFHGYGRRGEQRTGDPGCCVSHVDLLVTEAAGVKAGLRQVVDGLSLVPLLTRGAPLKRRALYWHFGQV